MDKKSIVLYLHVHQPWRVRDDYTVFDIGSDRGYFGEETGIKAQTNGDIFKKVAEKSWGLRFFEHHICQERHSTKAAITMIVLAKIRCK